MREVSHSFLCVSLLQGSNEYQAWMIRETLNKQIRSQYLWFSIGVKVLLEFSMHLRQNLGDIHQIAPVSRLWFRTNSPSLVFLGSL